jgi:hypothetical protein
MSVFVQLKQLAYARIEEQFKCSHPQRAVRRRTIVDGRTTYVSQCIECGHTSSPISAKVALLQDATPGTYDPQLQVLRRAAKSAEYLRTYLALRPALAAEYHAYLDSPQWRRRRNEAVQRASGKCEICDQSSTEVHHLNYQRVGAELPHDLLAVCRACHELIHAICES